MGEIRIETPIDGASAVSRAKGDASPEDTAAVSSSDWVGPEPIVASAAPQIATSWRRCVPVGEATDASTWTVSFRPGLYFDRTTRQGPNAALGSSWAAIAVLIARRGPSPWRAQRTASRPSRPENRSTDVLSAVTLTMQPRSPEGRPARCVVGGEGVRRRDAQDGPSSNSS